jgi:formate dehydrogenase iron-sulfur subunit
MRKGFIFYPTRCVDCGACIASCILENKWDFHPRAIYRINPEASLYSSVLNISMACNHCEKPSCLTGCPTSAYLTDKDTKAVFIDEEKCMGCNYCKWNCPYDAPKSGRATGVIGKCNLCMPALKEGLMPACASACPTGALNYNKISEEAESTWPDNPIQKRLNPAVEIRAVNEDFHLKIVPAGIFDQDIKATLNNVKNISGEWSLIAFSFLSTLSVSMLVTAFTGKALPDFRIIMPLIILSGMFSLFHLNRKLRAWRSIQNIYRSPLSREIVSYFGYLLVSAGALLTETPGMILAASLTGMALLITIDMVYIFPENRAKIIFHSGQTFLTGLLMISFFSALKFPFLFVAVIKLISVVYNIYTASGEQAQPVLRYLRTAFLLISCVSFITGISYPGAVISIIFITGEFTDRILFYFDFEPVNIKSVTHSQFTYKPDTNEKGRN